MLICLNKAAKALKIHPVTARRWCKHLGLRFKYWTGPDGKGPDRKRVCLRVADYTLLAEALRAWHKRKRVSHV